MGRGSKLTFLQRRHPDSLQTHEKKHSTELIIQFSSVQFSHSVVSDSLRPHESQHARPPCPSPTPAVDSNSCPLSQWCHPTISSYAMPFSSHLKCFRASGSFPMRQFMASTMCLYRIFGVSLSTKQKTVPCGTVSEGFPSLTLVLPHR